MKLSSIALAAALALTPITATAGIGRPDAPAAAQCEVGAPSKEQLKDQVKDANMTMTVLTGLKFTALAEAVQKEFGPFPELADTDEIWVVQFDGGVNLGFFAKDCFVGVLPSITQDRWERIRDSALPPA